jgi:hypothetical protein
MYSTGSGRWSATSEVKRTTRAAHAVCRCRSSSGRRRWLGEGRSGPVDVARPLAPVTCPVEFVSRQGAGDAYEDQGLAGTGARYGGRTGELARVGGACR